MIMDNQPVTIYRTSEFFGNIVKIEGKLKEIRNRKYAQYDNAVEVVYIPKGKRSPRSFISCGRENPLLIIITGLNHPSPDSMFGKPDNNGAAYSKYASFDPRWKHDFSHMIDDYLKENKNVTVIHDSRA
jgi:hypothetical protein